MEYGAFLQKILLFIQKFHLIVFILSIIQIHYGRISFLFISEY